MGVPAFFRWLSRKYPSVVASCVELKPIDDNGRPIPVDPSDPNPNGVEFDNLYLDMNGIIHPCTHPEDKPPPKDEDDMMIAIFECIDRLMNIVRPRKLLYMAVDGVAPRAKMNQQRSRRFRAAKESADKAKEIAKIREKLETRGVLLPPPKDAESQFDSNCITPGTPFMTRLSKCLHYYAHNLLNKHPAWKHLKVILSDASVPGEGEHKIMDFIRKQRGQPNHDPNTKHCLCGADADLIMLGLATHEPYFTIIREEFKPNHDKPCDICGRSGHEMKECTGLDGPQETVIKMTSETQFIFVRLNVLREYLRRELDMQGLPFTYDFERVVDDWVFMCFFVGNDFLPHLPSLEIREGAIDRLITLYKKCVYKTGGYLTDNGNVNLNRVQLIMSDLGVVEDEIFKKRQQNELSYRAREKAKKKRLKAEKAARDAASVNKMQSRVLSGQYAPLPVGGEIPVVVNPRQELYQQRVRYMHTSSNFETNNVNSEARGTKRKLEESDSEEEEQVHDAVRLWESGFKDRYYETKFGKNPECIEFRHKVAFEYVRGLCWVLKYYYQGCPSWKWYFPYHYAPFASDFVNIAALPVEFEKSTKPFKPLEQLMGVFPAASKSHIPEPWAKLMCDPDSPIIDFYPEDFEIDLNGKKFAWQGVALLPFVDEERLFKALEPYYDLLSPEERARNCLGDDRLYVTEAEKNYTIFKGLYGNLPSDLETEHTVLTSDGILGKALLTDEYVKHGSSMVAPVTGLQVIYDNKVLCVRYRNPEYLENHVFVSSKLPGAEDPLPVLKPLNLSQEESMGYRPQIGMARHTRVASLGISGHRALGFYTHQASAEYTSVRNSGLNSVPYNQYGQNTRTSYNDETERRNNRNSNYQRSSSNSYNSYDEYRTRNTYNVPNIERNFENPRGYQPEGYYTRDYMPDTSRFQSSYDRNATNSYGGPGGQSSLSRDRHRPYQRPQDSRKDRNGRWDRR